MSAFTLDTSGQLIVNQTRIMWPDLDAFTQGYVEALLAAGFDWDGKPYYRCSFSDLSPEALEMILADCAAWGGDRSMWNFASVGAKFWSDRQAAKWPDFPPLTISLGDDGRVHLAAKA